MKNEEGGVIFELKKVLSDVKTSATSEVKGVTGLALGLILVSVISFKSYVFLVPWSFCGE